MEVGEHRINRLEGVGRIDEGGAAAMGGDHFAIVQRGDRFQGAHRGGAYSNHTATRRFGFANGLRSGFGHFVVFGLHLVLFHAFGLHGFEGARAHVERDEGALDAHRLQLVQEGFGKV